jgi:hypothetical protein
VELDGVQEVKVEVDGGPEANAGQEVELEVDAGPEVNSVQELEVDGGQGLGRGQGLEVNGRQEVNDRRGRRVTVYYRRVCDGRHTPPVTQKHPQPSSVLLTNESYAMYVIEY